MLKLIKSWLNLNVRKANMNSKHSRIPYFLAIVSGFLIPLTAGIEPFPIPLVVFCLLFAGAFGFFWPTVSWRWGIWIVGPSFCLTILSIVFAGQVEIFIKKDLPVFFIALITVCLGSFVFAMISNKKTKKI